MKLGKPINDLAWNPARNAVCDSVCDSVYDNICNDICHSISISIGNQTRTSVRNTVSDRIWTSERNLVHIKLTDLVKNSLWYSVRQNAYKMILNMYSIIKL
jgi:hypothetical protein